MRHGAPWLGLVLATALATACVTDPALRRGDDLAARGDWNDALASYRAASAEHPDDPGITARLEGAKRHVADGLVAEAEKAEAAGTLDAALALLDRARHLVPDHPGVARVGAVLGAAFEKAATAALPDHPKRAFDAAANASRLSPSSPAIAQTLARARGAYVAKLYDDGDHAAKQGHPGAALAAMARITTLVPHYRDVAGRLVMLREAVRASAAWTVAVRPFHGPGVLGRVGRGLAGRLLRAKAPDTCPGLHLVGSTIGGPGLELTGRVTSYAAANHADTHTEVKTWQAGTHTEKNPERAKIRAEMEADAAQVKETMKQVRALMDAVDKKKTALVEASPDDDVAAMRQDLDATQSTLDGAKKTALAEARALVAARKRYLAAPRTVKVPVMRHAPLTISDVTRTLHLVVTASARDLTRGTKVISDRRYEAKATTEDTHHPALPAAHIAADPLRFPTPDAELREKAVDDVVASLLADLATTCATRQAKLLSAGKDRAAVGDVPAATEWYAQAVLAAPKGKVPEAAKKFFRRQWGIDDVKVLVGDGGDGGAGAGAGLGIDLRKAAGSGAGGH